MFQYALADPVVLAQRLLTGNLSLQDLYNRASHDLLAMAKLDDPRLPPVTC